MFKRIDINAVTVSGTVEPLKYLFFGAMIFFAVILLISIYKKQEINKVFIVAMMSLAAICFFAIQSGLTDTKEYHTTYKIEDVQVKEIISNGSNYEIKFTKDDMDYRMAADDTNVNDNNHTLYIQTTFNTKDDAKKTYDQSLLKFPIDEVRSSQE